MSLALQFTIVGSATLASRITGFIRDILIAAVLGTGPVADVYVAAFLIPNLFRKMMSEGALNAAIVPRLARLEREGGVQAARGFSDDLLSLLCVVLIVLVAVAEFAMPQIMAVLAYGFRVDEAKFADAVLFGRIAFPFVGFILVVAVMSAVLNAVERYAIAALVPLVLNILMIGVLLALVFILPGGQRQAGLVLVSTVLVAGFFQLVILWISAAREGFDVRPRLGDALMGRVDPSAKTLLLLALPGMVIAGSGHVQMIVASQFASLEPRAISWLYFADRLFQLPVGFVASAVGVVLLPRLARAFHQGDGEAMAEAQSESLVFASLLILPATVALFVLAKPITAVLFQRGAFLAEDARATAALLKVLALALPAFVLIKVILPTFLAREEMRPPLIAVGLGLAANIAGAALFRDIERAIAPAAGVAIGVWVNALVLAFAAQGRMSILPRAWARAFAALLAAGVMGFCIGWLALEAKDWMAAERAFYEKGSVLALICLAGLAIYAAAARLLGAFTFRRLRRIGQKGAE
ncbi:MAG: murein biosynthesis integral membrane protein MurJ [Rhizobiales bacterium PAR1]|nr:MAG: murein biosynthesis integral membrane protein MurJ [Rhizobiales bacterium PAR1]